MGSSVSFCTTGTILYDRLGGAPCIDALVEGLFERLLEDTRTRTLYMFTDVDSLKVRYKKYLANSLGGPHSYKGQNLRKIHCEGNRGEGLTGTQLGAFLELLIDTMIEMYIDLTLVEEVFYSFLGVFSIIMNKDDTLCKRIGGLEVVSQLVRHMSEACKENELFQSATHQHVFGSEHIQNQVAKFLAAIIFGGSREVVYRGPGFKFFDDQLITLEQCEFAREAFADAMVKYNVPHVESLEVKGLLLAIEQLVADR
eukprot:GEMP01072113.1.p1 GENE.GEMP01072113.1~~GEMP01072113.1.p1  ORF type:complete len:255 (+),score=43.50 GEMP01072113.1:183-947(+)